MALVLWLLAGQTVLAHSGGTPRLTAAPVGPYRLYAWSDPEPWRVGEVHLSLVVAQPADNAATGGQVETPVADADVTVVLTPVAAPGQPITVRATPQEQLGTLYYEVDAALPTAGSWQVDIAVSGPNGGGDAGFTIEVLPAQRLNWWLVGGAGVTLLIAVALMGVWSRQRPAAAAPTRRAEHRAARAPGENTR
jgi:hypothetical protein